MLAQLVLEPRSRRPSLNPRRQRLRVDLQDPIQAPQIERDHRPIPQPRLDPADDARPTAEGHHSRPLRLTPRENRLDLRLVPWKRHQIWRILKFPPKPPHHIPIGLSQSMRNPLVVLIREEISQLTRSPEPRLAQLNRIESHRLLQLAPEPKPLPDPGSSLLKLLPRRRLILVPPSPVLEPPRHESYPPVEAGCPSPGGSVSTLEP